MELKINLCPAKISEFEHTKRLAWEIERQCPLVNTHMEYKWDKKWIDLVIYDNKDIIRAICECKNRRGRTDTQI
jgi:hypothetical protein